MADFNTLSPQQQQEVLRLGLGQAARTPGNMSRVRQLASSDAGYMAGLMSRAGHGNDGGKGAGGESQVANAQVSALQRSMNKSVGEDANPQQKSEGAGPAKKKMGMPEKNMKGGGGGDNSTVAAYPGSHPPDPAAYARTPDDNGGGDSTVDDGSNWLAAGIAAGTLAVVGGAVWKMRNGQPVAPLTPEESMTMGKMAQGAADYKMPNRAVPQGESYIPSNALTPVDPAAGAMSPTVAKISDSIDANDGPIDVPFEEVPRGAPTGAPGSSPDNPIPMENFRQPPQITGGSAEAAQAGAMERAAAGTNQAFGNELGSMPGKYNIPLIEEMIKRSASGAGRAAARGAF